MQIKRPVRVLRVAIYCRISKDRVGAGLGVKRQEKDCRELLERLGLGPMVITVYPDNDLSAYSGKPRPKYRQLLADIRAGKVDLVICWHTDRLHRSPAELEEWINVVDPRGVPVHTVKAGPIDLATPSGRLVARQLGAVARYEVEHQSDKQQRQKREAVEKGLWRGGPRPFGFEADGVTVVEAEEKVIKDVAERALAGESLYSITSSLNKEGITTSAGKPWGPTSLRRMLLRARNIGMIECGGDVVGPATWPAVIDAGTWRSLRRKLTDPARNTEPASYDLRWLGSGIYLCGICDDGTTAKSASGGRGSQRWPAYVCRKQSHLSRASLPVDQFVEELVLRRLSRPDARLLLASQSQLPDVETLHKRREDLVNQLTEIGHEAVAAGIPLLTVAVMTKDVEKKIEELDAQLEASTTDSALKGFADADDVRAAWKAATVGRRKAVVRELLTVTLVRAPRGRPAGWRQGEPYFHPDALQTHWLR